MQKTRWHPVDPRLFLTGAEAILYLWDLSALQNLGARQTMPGSPAKIAMAATQEFADTVILRIAPEGETASGAAPRLVDFAFSPDGAHLIGAFAGIDAFLQALWVAWRSS